MTFPSPGAPVNKLAIGCLAVCAGLWLCACKPPPPSPVPTPQAEGVPPASPAPEPEPAQTSTQPASAQADTATPADAEAVVRDYYAAINARDFATAYAQWSDTGAASGQTPEDFRDGYANTTSVEASIGKATAEEGAAGSRFILVPVELRARQKDDSLRRYRGYFVLRAVMADGASAEQQRWRLYSAEIERLPDQSSKR